MTRAVYLIGPPGVGKSTLMDGLLAPFERRGPIKVPAPVRTTPLSYEELWNGGRPVGCSLGFRRKSFSGTDALGMSVNPQAVAWAETGAAGWGEIWGEGARLANRAFLQALDRHTDLTVVELVAAPRMLDERCALRGSSQSTAWRSGAATRARTLSSELMMKGVRVEEVDANGPADAVLADVQWRLGQ